MKSLAFVPLIALMLLSGCQHSSASKLAGRWDLLPPEQISNNKSSNNDDSKEDAAGNTEDLYNSIAGGESVGTMSLVFHRNGKLETFTDFPMASTGRPKTGTWKFQSWDETKQELVIECDLFDELTSTRVRFIDNDTIQLVPPNLAVLETQLRFARSD